MEAKLRTSARIPVGEGNPREENPARKFDGYEMLVGEGMDSEEARNSFIDSAEKLLEFESLERGQQHSRKNFDYATEHSELHPVEER